MRPCNFSKGEKDNILKFLHGIQVPKGTSQRQFRSKVIFEINKAFGFEQASFWLINSNLDLYDPVTNLPDQIVMRYIDYFYRVDPHYPANLPYQLATTRDIISPPDIAKQSNNEYFSYLLTDYQLKQRMVLLFKQGGLPFAGLAVYVTKNSRDISIRDGYRFKEIIPFVSQILSSKLLIEDLEYRENIYQKALEHAPIGLFIFDEQFKVCHFNAHAWEYCSDLSDRQKMSNPIEEFLSQLIKNETNTNWKFGLEKTIVSASLQKYSLKIFPTIFREKIVYNAYLLPRAENKQIHLLNNLSSREKEIIQLIRCGLTNQEIAGKLFISLSTVKTHIDNIFGKIQVNNRTALCYKLKDVEL